jgi:two-component system sensor histidine kinase/response regulator
MALKALLDPLQCDIVLAETGEEALQRLLLEDYAVILLDVQLPGLDGFEVAELIKQRERTRHVPLIFLTATSGTQTAMRGYSVGAVDFVSKPFDPVVLRSKVQAFLELSAATTQLQRQAAELEQMLAERQAHEALLQRQAEELQRSNEELENLAAIASHDLVEPLRVIAGYSELLREHAESSNDAEVTQITQAIERGVGRMQRLIDGILAYARAGVPVPREEVDTGEVVGEVLLALEPEIERRSAIIDVEALPTVSFNRAQLFQILTNVIGNAIKFVPPGRTPTVTVTAARVDNSWVVAVSDNGIGVSDEERRHIFELFAPRVSDGATGMGLAICARILERSGGHLDVAPGPDGGSVFTLSIPDDPAVVQPAVSATTDA